MTEPISELCLGDLQAVIRDFERNQERSLQVEIGPSQVGEPCSRRLVMQLLGADDINADRDMWPATVGTAVHQLLADAFRRNNTVLASQGRPARWLVEQPVTIRPGLIGHTDLIDLWTWTVIDHKNVSVKSLRDHKKTGHPGQQYEIQAHLYGLGWARAGLPIKTVAIAFYPKSGMMRDSWLWTADYDENIALAALDRMDTLLADANMAELEGDLDQWLQALPRDTTHCDWCPYHDAEHRAPSDTPTATCGGTFEDPLHEPTRQEWSAPGIFK
jgi:hypothetical protein